MVDRAPLATGCAVGAGAECGVGTDLFTATGVGRAGVGVGRRTVDGWRAGDDLTAGRAAIAGGDKWTTGAGVCVGAAGGCRAGAFSIAVCSGATATGVRVAAGDG